MSKSLYLYNAYGNGIDPEPVKKGEMLTDIKGDLYEFSRITRKGKIEVTEEIAPCLFNTYFFSPNEVGGEILDNPPS